MNQGNLTRLIYASVATAGVGHLDIKAILLKARTTNAARSISGMLLYASGSFFQVLEGEASTLDDLFLHIVTDPRHRNVTKIIKEPIAARDFGDWTMGFCEGESSGLESIEGVGDFLGQGGSLVSLPPGRAKKLLTAFAQGRWRARLEGA